MVKKGFDLNQGIKGGKYSILKIFHHPEKLKALAEGRVSAPLYVRVKPTNTCCHNCFYCVYNPEFSSIHPESNREDMIPREKMMEILDDFKNMGVKAVTYSGGGEPLTYPHIIETLKKTLEYGIKLSMITNAQKLNGEAAEILYNANWVRVSLDYCNPDIFSRSRNIHKEHFHQVKKNIEKFSQNKNPACDFEVNCVVHEFNCENLFEIAEFCKNLGISNVRFAPVWKKNFRDYHLPFKDKAIEQIEMAKKLIDNNFDVGSTYDRYFNKNTGEDVRDYPRCFYMEIVPVIAADQNVYTCHNSAYETEGKVGSIKDKPFKELWFSPKTAEFFKNFDPRERCKHECSNDEKNRLLNEWLTCQDEKVVGFI